MQQMANTAGNMKIVSGQSKIDVGMSKPASFISITFNTMKVRLLMWKRYSPEAVGQLLQIVILTAVFFLFATAVGFRQITEFGTREIFIFFLSGFLILTFDTVAIWSPVNATNRELTNGTLEYLYFTPMQKYPYYLGYLLGSVITSASVGTIPMLLLLSWYANLSIDQVLMIIMVIIVLLISLLAMGILISLTVILFKQVQGLISLLGMITQFFTGAFIPLTSLPSYVQPIALLFPHTYAYELLRYYSLGGNWPLAYPLLMDWVLMIFFAVVYTAIALILLKKVVKHAKQKGLHIL